MMRRSPRAPRAAPTKRAQTVLPNDGPVLWFNDSPPAGDAACLCSRCTLPIEAEEAPILRLGAPPDWEARWHRACVPFALCVASDARHTFDDLSSTLPDAAPTLAQRGIDELFSA